MTNRQQVKEKVSPETFEHIERLYDAQNEAERADYLGGPGQFWAWMLERLDTMVRQAVADPAKAKSFAELDERTLKNDPGIRGAHRIRLELNARMWREQARLALAADGCDEEGQKLMFDEGQGV